MKNDRATLLEKDYSGVFVLNTTAMGKNAVYQVSWETNVWNLSDILHEVTKAWRLKTDENDFLGDELEKSCFENLDQKKWCFFRLLKNYEWN